MKRKKTTILFILIAIITVAAFLRIDDRLDPKLQQLMDYRTALNKNNPYFYLMGIDAPQDQSPWNKGALFYDALSSDSENANIPAAFKEINQGQTITLNEEEIHCRIRGNESCLSDMLLLVNDADQLLAKYDWLVTRYQQFLRLKGYKTGTPVSVDEPMPPYKVLSFANRLLIIKIFANAKRGGANEAIVELDKLISSLRLHLQEEDTLVGKMVLLGLLSENIDMLSLLGRRLKLTHFQPIKLLSQNERSLVTAIDREALLAHFATKKGLFKSIDHVPSRVKKWLLAFMIKPNMIANATYPAYKHAAMLSLQSPDQLVDRLEQPIPQAKLSYVRNLIGSTLLRTGQPDLRVYVLRIFDVNAKIALLNQTFGQASHEIKISALSNAYEPKKSFFWSENKRRLCTESPRKTTQDLQCLLINSH